MLIVILIAIVLLLVVFLYFSYRIKNIPDKKNLEFSIDFEVKKFLNNKDIDLVVGIYKDEKIYTKSYTQKNINENSIFQIASITKVFTSLLLQILCDEKVVKMEQTLDELIGTKFKLSNDAKKITLKQLATHTSGLPNIPKEIQNKILNQFGKEGLVLNPYSHIDTNLVFKYLEDTKDNHKMGNFVYSNYGMGLLGHILELITNKSYEALIIEKILNPLKMENTNTSLTQETKELLTKGYNAKGKQTPLWEFNALYGAGAINSNVADMLKFIKSNFDTNSTLYNSFYSISNSNIGWMEAGFMENFFGNKNILWHNGMVGGYSSYLSIDPNKKTGLIVLTNRSIDVTMLGIMLTRQIRTQSWFET